MFVPCTRMAVKGPRERRSSSEMVRSSGKPSDFIWLLKNILGVLHRYRPDLQCLFTFPLAYSETIASPTIDENAIDSISRERMQSDGYLLRQMQFLFPYLRSSDYALRSPVGIVSGTLVNSAQQRGVWRSVAGVPMFVDARLFPEVDTHTKLRLRDEPGLGVITHQSGKLTLDDERICVPSLHRNDYLYNSNDTRVQSLRSAEVVRFLGYLVRQLRSLGERLVFNVDYRDPRPAIVLDTFFRDLYQRGALRGRLPENAYEIRQISSREAMVAYDIEIAPAFPIDKIRLSFTNHQGDWVTELHSGN